MAGVVGTPSSPFPFIPQTQTAEFPELDPLEVDPPVDVPPPEVVVAPVPEVEPPVERPLVDSFEPPETISVELDESSPPPPEGLQATAKRRANARKRFMA